MGQPVVHFEIVGSDPEGLRRYYGDLFGCEFGIGDAATEAVSQPGRYGFVDGDKTGDGTVINGGVAGGAGFQPRVLDCDRPERAAEIAARFPDVRSTAVEVRPIVDMSGQEA